MTIAILDSGIVKGDSRFVYWTNDDEIPDNDNDDDDNHYIDDVIGTNILAMSFGGAFPADEVTRASIRNHGTHVAGIATGRGYDSLLRDAIDERVAAMIVKVADDLGYVSPGNASSGVSYAARHGARIVNMSFTGPYEEALLFAIQNSPTVLFVTAAGNDKYSPGDIATKEIYPASFCDEFPNVITVAAHDSDGNLACFSNFGEVVDIAAPGVRVRSTIDGGETKALSGTSQAAPFITLAAALLISKGMEEPLAVRQRLINTVDYRPELRGKVASEGTLNLVKALAFDNDLIVTDNGEIHRGSIIGPRQLTFQDAGEPVEVDRIGRVVFRYDPEPARRIKVRFRDGTSKFVSEWPMERIRFLTLGGREVSFDVASILEVIPRG